MLVICAPAHAQGIPSRRIPVDLRATDNLDGSPAGTRVAGASSASGAQTDPANAADAADGVWIPRGIRSLRVERADEVVRAAPDGESDRRGTVARDSLLPALEARLGPGCASRWIRVAADGWMCLDYTALSTDAPRADSQPVTAPGEIVPHRYGFAAYSGVPVYRRLQDVDIDDRDQELERGWGLAIDGTARLGSATFARTVTGRWIAMRDLHFARISQRTGAEYEPNETLASIGFTSRRTYAFNSIAEATRGVPPRNHAFVDARTPVHIREESTVGRRRWIRSDEGWIDARNLRMPEATTPPDGVGATERWVDVDTRRQMLVAFEGARPVLTSLVSTGRSGAATHRGVHRVWVKLATSDMSNMDTDQLDTTTQVYSVQRVPWVMYFHGDQALHGAYWHDQYGTARSHGCVNLPPRVARWIFDWAPPALPAGWTAVFPTAQQPGLRVRVR